MARKTGIVGLGLAIVLGSRFRLSFGFDVKPSSTIDAVIMSDLSIYRYIEYMTTIKLVTLLSLGILSVDVTSGRQRWLWESNHFQPFLFLFLMALI